MLTFEIDTSTFDGDNNPPETQVDDIVVVNPKGNWHLYNYGSLELTRDCDEQYRKLWKLPEIDSFIRNILIIGGGDFQLVDLVSNHYKYTDITLVDPHIDFYREFHEFYLGKDISDYYHNKVIKQNVIFSEYLNTHKNGYYDLVLIDCSEPEFDLTSEIYCEKFFDQLKEFNINDNCKYLMYLPPKRIDSLLPIIKKKFKHIHLYGRFIEDWNEYCDVCHFTNSNTGIENEDTVS